MFDAAVRRRADGRESQPRQRGGRDRQLPGRAGVQALPLRPLPTRSFQVHMHTAAAAPLLHAVAAGGCYRTHMYSKNPCVSIFLAGFWLLTLEPSDLMVSVCCVSWVSWVSVFFSSNTKQDLGACDYVHDEELKAVSALATSPSL